MQTSPLCRTANRHFGRKARGFTFVETLVVTTVMAVLTSAGVPSLKGFVAKRMADSQMSDLSASLREARSEAMKRGKEVTVCAMLAKPDDSEPECVSSGQDWSAGWLVFIDEGSHGEFDTSDTLVRLHRSPSGAGHITSQQRSITFKANGISSKGNTTLRVSPPGVAAADKDADGTAVVCVNKPGRARVVHAAACAD